jgi:hypothetical protein
MLKFGNLPDHHEAQMARVQEVVSSLPLFATGAYLLQSSGSIPRDTWLGWASALSTAVGGGVFVFLGILVMMRATALWCCSAMPTRGLKGYSVGVVIGLFLGLVLVGQSDQLVRQLTETAPAPEEAGERN